MLTSDVKHPSAMIATATNQDESLTIAFGHWKEEVLKELKGAPFDKKLLTRTFEELTLQPLYTRAEIQDIKHLGTSPAETPFLRGCRHSRPGRPWRIAQEIDARDPVTYNHDLLTNLQGGQDAVVLRCRLGEGDAIDASAAQRPRSGLRLFNIGDVGAALKGVDVRAVELHVYTSADPRPAAALFLGWCSDQNVPVETLRGSILADPLGEAACCGEFLRDPGDRYGPVADWTKWASQNVVQLRTLGVDASIWADAGATATQELALALATAAEYIRALEALGVELYIIANHLQFQLSIGSQFFTEIAKFRAFRPLFTRLLMAFGADPSLGRTASVGASTGFWNKTLLDPHVNMLRATTEALSAVLGGCDRLHIDPYDQVSGQTSEFSRRIALNIHTLMAEEFGFSSPIDAAGGSWYVEKLTDDLARASWKIFQELERRGGMATCLKTGYARELVIASQRAKTGRVATRALPLVGTNLFPKPKEKAPPAPRLQQRAVTTSVDSSPGSRRGSSRPGENWSFESAMAKARGGASVETWASSPFAESDEIATFAKLTFRRGAEGFEHIRREVDALTLSRGRSPKACVIRVAPIGQYHARTDFSAGFFSVGGFTVCVSDIYGDAASAAQAALKSGAEVVVLCSTDEAYPAIAPAFAREFKRLNPAGMAVLAGLPADVVFVAQLQAAGFDDFIHLKANCEEVLERLIRKIGEKTDESDS